MKQELNRRRFLQIAAIGSGSILLMSCCTDHSGISPWRFFTLEEAKLLDLLVEQIIPTDEWPGARDAGVTNYIDKQLVGPFARHKEKYRKGLASIQTSCRILYKSQFEDLSWDEQTNFLKKMESGILPGLLKGVKKEEAQPEVGLWEEGLDRVFFGLLRDHTMQGYYGSPRHGGNKNYVSYQMVGLDYPFNVGQNRYKS